MQVSVEAKHSNEIKKVNTLFLSFPRSLPFDHYRFPCAATASLLIKCGADVDAMTKAGDTPLHIIVGYQKHVSDFITLHSIIVSLLDANAHIDYVNRRGETPYTSATTGVAEIILKSKAQISLKCLAAQAIGFHKLAYQNNVPFELIDFVRLHCIR